MLVYAAPASINSVDLYPTGMQYPGQGSILEMLLDEPQSLDPVAHTCCGATAVAPSAAGAAGGGSSCGDSSWGWSSCGCASRRMSLTAARRSAWHTCSAAVCSGGVMPAGEKRDSAHL